MANIEWMQSLLKEETDAYIRLLFRVDDWLVASDGKFLCAVRCDEIPPEPAVDKFNLAKEVRRLVEIPLGEEEFDLSHMKAWSVRPDPPCIKCNGTKKFTCPECKGTGETECTCTCGDEHDAPCESCDKGVAECSCVFPSIPALVFGECVNVIVLHRAIKNFSGTFRVSKNTSRSCKPLMFGGENWRAAVMPIKSEPKEVYEPQRSTVVAG